MIELIVKKEDREINRYFLPQGTTTIGRAEDNGIILDDSCVSRRHAQIKVEGARVMIEDLGSGNGTYQGETRIEQQDLGDGDEVLIDPFRLLLRTEKPAARPPDSTRPVPSSRPSPKARLDPPPARAARTPGGSAAGGPRFEVVRGSGGPYLLTGQASTIGRSEDATLTLKDPSASRKHAQVERNSDGWVLNDLGSANGTYVNGASAKEVILTDGDIILIGNTELRFVDPAALPDEAPPALSTGPVVAGRGRLFEEMDLNSGPRMTDDMEMPLSDMDDPGGDPYEAGAMPMGGSVGGTEAGAPVAAFGEQDATGEGDLYAQNAGNTMTGGGIPEFADGGYDDGGGYGGEEAGFQNDGYGMELGDGSLFPGGERPPDSLVGRYIFSLKTNPRTRIISIGVGVIFVLVCVIQARNNAASGPKTIGNGQFVVQLDKQQQLTLDTMQVFERDARAAIDSEKEKKDYATAFDRYSRIVRFADKPEMTNVLEAQKLGWSATDAIYTMHEALLVSRLLEVTRKGAKKDAATEALIAKNRKNGIDHLARARRTRAVSWYNKAIAAFDVVLEHESDSDIETMRSEARSERSKLLGVISQNQLDALNKKCAGYIQQAAAQANKRTATGYRDAITMFDRVLKADPDGRTQYPEQAQRGILVVKKRLRDLARPLRDQGAAAAAKQEWLEARAAYRKAVRMDPFDPTLVSERSAVDRECIENAKRQISEAKAYMSVNNYPEAMKALTLALKYADSPKDREHGQANDLVKTIRRNTER